MSHPDDTGSSAVGKALSAIRRLRRPATEPVEPSPAADQSVPPAPRANTEDASAITPSAPADIPGTGDHEDSAEASDDDSSDEPASESPTEPTEELETTDDEPSEPEPEPEPEPEKQDPPVAATPAPDLDDDPENAENEIPSAHS